MKSQFFTFGACGGDVGVSLALGLKTSSLHTFHVRQMSTQLCRGLWS